MSTVSRSEQSLQYAGHIYVKQRLCLACGEKEDRVGNVLADAGQGFYFRPSAGELAASCRHLSCKGEHGRRPSPPESDGLEQFADLFDRRASNRLPSREPGGELVEEGRDRFCPRPLEQQLREDKVVEARPFLPPREVPAVRVQPFQSARLTAAAVRGEMTTGSLPTAISFLPGLLITFPEKCATPRRAW